METEKEERVWFEVDNELPPAGIKVLVLVEWGKKSKEVSIASYKDGTWTENNGYVIYPAWEKVVKWAYIPEWK